jgi:tetratricopeptide (TPR) repeat protein
LARDIDVRLASLYEQSENWAAAALEYVGLSKSALDKEVRRQSLYRAAEIYLAENDVAAAIEYFRDYAHTYKRPLDIRMEAIHNMDGLYQRDGDEQKRRFWLNKKIEVHKEMGRAATARATYLAASAQLVFANDERLLFAAIQLTRPLKRSLKKKQSALKKTLKAFEKVAAYEVVEFTTASTYEIADLYSALSKSIMSSDRPQDLSALEMEQYDILLEEQAFPFEEQAIDLHQINLRRAWSGTYDDWVRKSFAELMRLMPGRFNKPESEVTYAQAIH